MIRKIMFCFLLLSAVPLLAEGHMRSYYTIGALGDSISTGFNSTGFGNRKKDAWSTGNSERYVKSHYLRLKDLMPGAQILSDNQAVAGSKSADIPEQARLLAAKVPDYATLMIGANDLCAWYTDEEADFQMVDQNISQGIQTMIEANPQIKLLMVPVPNMYRLWQVGSTNSCQWKWDAFGICSPVLGSDRTDEEREAFVKRWVTYNKTLESVAARYPEQVRFDKDIANISFESDHISSIDCFHPSGKGQDFIAQRTWDTGWFTGASAKWVRASILSIQPFDARSSAISPKF